MPHRRRSSSYQLLRLVEETGQIGFWSIDLATGETRVSPTLMHITGLSDVEGPRSILDDLIHPEDRATDASLLDMLYDGRSIAKTFRILRPDRTSRWVTLKAQVIPGPDGRPGRAEGVVFDVSEPHEARLVAERSQARYQGLIDAIAAVVWTTSVDGHLRPSRTWENLTGQSAQAMQGEGWLDAVHHDDRQRVYGMWQAAVSHQSSYDADYRVRCVDGCYRWFNSRATPLRDPHGLVREWIGVMFEISGRVPANPNESDDAHSIVTGALVRGARAILGWTAAELAEAAAVSVSSVKRFEEDSTNTTRSSTRLAMKEALERAGVGFVMLADGRCGILRSATSPDKA